MAGGRQLAEATAQLRGDQQPRQPERAQPGGVHLHGHGGLGLGAGTRAQPHRVREEVPPEHMSPSSNTCHHPTVILHQAQCVCGSVEMDGLATIIILFKFLPLTLAPS